MEHFSSITEAMIRANVLNYNYTTYLADTPYCSLITAGGRCSTKSAIVSGNGATILNLFTVTGICRIFELYAIATTITNSTTFTNVKFTLYDGTASVDITNTVNGSGATANSILVKTDVSNNALIFSNASACKVLESSSNRVYYQTLLIQKTGAVATYIRLNFTGDANTNMVWSFLARWAPLTPTSLITAV